MLCFSLISYFYQFSSIELLIDFHFYAVLNWFLFYTSLNCFSCTVFLPFFLFNLDPSYLRCIELPNCTHVFLDWPHSIQHLLMSFISHFLAYLIFDSRLRVISYYFYFNFYWSLDLLYAFFINLFVYSKQYILEIEAIYERIAVFKLVLDHDMNLAGGGMMVQEKHILVSI